PRSPSGRGALLASLLVLVTLVAGPLSAQVPNPHSVQPERPTVATHAGTVSPGWLELESGLEYDRFRDATRAVALPVYLKFGIARRVQLGLSLPFISPPDAGLGPGDLSLGLKLRLAEGAGPLGDFAILPVLKLPTGSLAAGRGTGTTDASLLLISSHTFGPVALDLNVGITRRSGDGVGAPRTATLWTVSWGGPAVGGLGWVAEAFGFPETKGPAGSPGIVALLGGPTYRVAPWLVLDAGGILPLTGTGTQPKALYLGLTWNAGRYWPGGGRLSPLRPPPNSPRGVLRRSGR
ncbi:MAG TPA: transporter, partial [Gemmatimonadales bacterium]|nr:transporter [Gemmatimonadales bacterium]